MHNRLVLFEFKIRKIGAASRHLRLAFMLSVISASSSALAQANSEPVDAARQKSARICGAAWAPAPDGIPSGGEPRMVHARCWGTWLVLARADSFRVSVNFELEATVVELDRSGEVTVLLIRPDADGKPLKENITSSLALAAGRTSQGRLGGLALNLKQFPFTGRIALAQTEATSSSGAKASPEARAAQTLPSSGAGIEIETYIAQDRARMATATTK